MSHIVVCALYKFVTLDNFQLIQKPLLNLMHQHDIKGTLLLAREGINGTVASRRESIDKLLDFLHSDPRLANINYKESYTNEPPFLRSRVKLKKEIVTMGIEGIDPKRVVGTYVKPTDWNALISDPDVLLVDTRNDYEVQVGTFKDALNEQGFDEVYHLQGGILKYLEEVPAEESLWQGECFVFDERVTVNHQLTKGDYEQCNACRMPITAEDMQSEKYQHGISCPHCFDKTSAQQKARFAEREKQMQLAQQRGEIHIGSETAKVIAANRAKKQQNYEKQRATSLKKQHR